MSNKNSNRVSNPELHRAMMGKRSSSAASKHDPRPRKLRSRGAIRRNAIKREYT